VLAFLIQKKELIMSESEITFDESSQEKIAEKIYFFNKDAFTYKPKRLNEIPPSILKSNPDGKAYLKTPEGKEHLKKWNEDKLKQSKLENVSMDVIDYPEDGTNNDTYFKSIAKTLQTYNNKEDKFTNLFRTRFGLKPQINHDKKLMTALNRTILSDKDLLILTQQHFNEFGGVHDM
jgi:hypothetical protein